MKIDLVEIAVRELKRQKFQRITDRDIQNNEELTLFCIPVGYENKVKKTYGLRKRKPILSIIPAVTAITIYDDDLMSIHKKQGHQPRHYFLEDGIWKPFGHGSPAKRPYHVKPRFTYIQPNHDISNKVLQNYS